MPDGCFEDDFDEPVFDELGRLDESDDPDFEDQDAEESWSDVLPCPNCGADVYEDLPQCPACGEYITHSTHAFADRPWWWIVLGVIGIVTTIVLLALF